MVTVTHRWIQLVIGFWILLSPWILGYSEISIMKWSNLLCGLVLILLSVWAIFGNAAGMKKVE